MSAPKKNKNAQKNETEKATHQVQIRCTEAQKNSWQRQARQAGVSLTQWIIKKLGI